MTREYKLKQTLDWEDKYQTLKRILGVIAAPITGSLSPQVRANIFGREENNTPYNSQSWESFAYDMSCWVNASLGILPFLPRILTDIPAETLHSFPSYTMIYGGYKILESLYRAHDRGKRELNDTGYLAKGSLEGTIISKLLIEPLLKSKENSEIN